jgi:hypothetical protein
LPQEEYVQAAKLEISFTPQVVTRIFLLFALLASLNKSWQTCLNKEVD